MTPPRIGPRPQPSVARPLEPAAAPPTTTTAAPAAPAEQQPPAAAPAAKDRYRTRTAPTMMKAIGGAPTGGSGPPAPTTGGDASLSNALRDARAGAQARGPAGNPSAFPGGMALNRAGAAPAGGGNTATIETPRYDTRERTDFDRGHTEEEALDEARSYSVDGQRFTARVDGGPPGGEARRLAANAVEHAAINDNLDGTEHDQIINADGKDWLLTVRRNGTEVTAELKEVPPRPSAGKTAADMRTEMEGAGLTVGNFDDRQLAQVYDGFAQLSPPEREALRGYEIRRGTDATLEGTDSEVGGHTDSKNKVITINPAGFKGATVGTLPPGAGTFLHEAAHALRDRNKADASKFDKLIGKTDITPYMEHAEHLDRSERSRDIDVDPKQERFAEAYMLYRADPEFMQRNHPDLYEFFAEGRHLKSAERDAHVA